MLLNNNILNGGLFDSSGYRIIFPGISPRHFLFLRGVISGSRLVPLVATAITLAHTVGATHRTRSMRAAHGAFIRAIRGPHPLLGV